MKIVRLEIENFRSLKSQTWSPGDLNVVIGPNAGGKSNLLKALDLLRHSAKGRLSDYIQREGGMFPIVWDGKAEYVRFQAKMTPIPPHEGEQHCLTYKVRLDRLGTSSAYRIGYELLGNFSKVDQGIETQPFKMLERDSNHAVVFSEKAKRFQAHPDFVPEVETLLSLAAGPFAANHYIAGFQLELAAWTVYQYFNTDHDASVRSAQIPRPDTWVQTDGQNLVAVLHSLYTGSRDFKNAVNEAMRAAFGDDFDELVFPPAADQRIQLRIRWKSLSCERSASDLSDGTLRFLFLLAVLADPSPPPLIAIDEPETGLHPSMLPIVAEFAREASTRSQVILTTHSPEFLDAFGDDPPTTTIVDWAGGETRLRVLNGKELDYWLKQYSLGELYRSNELESMQ